MSSVAKSKRQKKNAGEKAGPSSAPDPPPPAPPDESGSEDEDGIVMEEGGTRFGDVYIPPAPPAFCSSGNTGPRLIITHIVNENFKSYAGRQVLGPFDKSFTSIIGPNGSGKSNVIDSMLFVFGYRATKIRSKKISVLIHKSEKHQNVRSCTVAVHFKQIQDLEGDNFENIPDSEIVIARTAFADSSSFYTVNGRRAQFKDVNILLRSHGIDLVHNRFLILQGEVEQIAMMKPKAQTEHDTGMLEYLEDIIGTSRFKLPIEKLAEKVNILNEERIEKVNKVNLAEKERDILIEPMEEAIEFLKFENNIAGVKNRIYQRNIFDAEQQLKADEEKKKEFDELMENLNKELKEQQKELSEKEEVISAKRKEMEKSSSQKEKLGEEFRKADNKLTQLKEEISQTNRKRKKAIETRKLEEAKLAELIKVPEKNNKEIGELTVVVEKLDQERKEEEAQLEKVLASLNKETEGLQENKDALSNKLIDLKKIKDNAQSKYDIAKSELDIYLSNEKKAVSRLEELKQLLHTTTEKLTKCKPQYEELSKKIPEAERNLTEAQAELGRISGEESKLRREYQNQRSQLEEKKQSMMTNRSRGKVLDFLMRQKDSGHLPGIFGRLGDLGGVDQKYDVAVSTACGPLDYIVVDTAETGKACVEMLKRDNVGRANFIALDKQEGMWRNFRPRIETPENVPRLFDLIKVKDERVKPAFYFGLRDTLVANTIEQASRVAYGRTRFRVVSLTGEIIETSGTMTGGGREPLRGRIGSSASVSSQNLSPGEMQGMERKVESLGQKLSSFREKQHALEETVTTLTRNIKAWKIDYNNCKIEIEGLSQQEPSLRHQVKEQEAVVKSCASDPKVVEKKTATMESLKEELDEAASNAGKIEKDVAEISKKINAITGGRTKTAMQKLETVTNKLDKVRAEMTKLKVAINTAARNKKKTEDKIQSLSTEISEAEQILTKTNNVNLSLREKAEELQEKINVATKIVEDNEENLKELTKSVTELVKKGNKLRSATLQENQKFEAVQKRMEEIKQMIPGIVKKRKGLSFHVIPGEENNVLELEDYTEDELKNFDLPKLLYKLTHLEETARQMKPNLNSIKEYNEKEALCKLRTSELDDVTSRRNEMRKGYDFVRKARLTEFMAGFTVISNKLKEMYQMITLGGDAEFELLDSLDPFTEGVVFSVRPPKKSWKNISNLSGGEKTLSSLALVFALHYYRPSPLYVMDEIDAALDFKNVSIVGNYIKDRTKNAQFIIISLRSNMFELADLLVGIYKTYNCTKSVTITPGLYSDNGEDKKGKEVKQKNSFDALLDNAVHQKKSLEIVQPKDKEQKALVTIQDGCTPPKKVRRK